MSTVKELREKFNSLKNGSAMSQSNTNRGIATKGNIMTKFNFKAPAVQLSGYSYTNDAGSLVFGVEGGDTVETLDIGFINTAGKFKQIKIGEDNVFGLPVNDKGYIFTPSRDA